MGSEVVDVSRTSCGGRTLKGAEARLFAETLLSLLDEEDSLQSADCPLGIECYDNLDYGQRVLVLATIADSLLREEVPAVAVTAVVEGTMAALFAHLRGLVEMGIDEPAWWRDWRRLIVAARREAGAENVPKPTCEDLEEWTVAIQELKNEILCGAEPEDARSGVSQPPGEAARRTQRLRAFEDSLVTRADRLNAEEIKARVSELRRLCQAAIERS
jgi:hypothetical protein